MLLISLLFLKVYSFFLSIMFFCYLYAVRYHALSSDTLPLVRNLGLLTWYKVCIGCGHSTENLISPLESWNNIKTNSLSKILQNYFYLAKVQILTWQLIVWTLDRVSELRAHCLRYNIILLMFVNDFFFIGLTKSLNFMTTFSLNSLNFYF